MQGNGSVGLPDSGDRPRRVLDRAMEQRNAAESGTVQLAGRGGRAIGAILQRNAIGAIDKGPVEVAATGCRSA